jgi:hypothetical protein
VTAVTVLCRDADADDRCDCAAVTAPRLRMKGLATPPGDDALVVKGEMTVPAAPALDPVATGARVVVEGVTGTLLDATLPAGAFDPATGTGWKEKKGKFKYKNPAGVLGIVKMTLGPTDGGAVKVVVVGKDASLGVAPADLPLRARVEVDAGAGQCGDIRFPGPAPAPACVFGATGKVTCK